MLIVYVPIGALKQTAPAYVRIGAELRSQLPRVGSNRAYYEA
jgi:hypothetical protein